MTNTPILKIENIVKHFDISGGFLDQLTFEHGRIIRKKTLVKAVNDVSLHINKGETLSVVGESGCGKSTLARVVMGLYPPTKGKIYYKGDRIDHLSHEQMLPFRKKNADDLPGSLCLFKPEKNRQADPERALSLSQP